MKEKEKELLVHEVNTMKDMDHVNVVKYVDRYLDKGRGRLSKSTATMATWLVILKDISLNADT